MNPVIARSHCGLWPKPYILDCHRQLRIWTPLLSVCHIRCVPAGSNTAYHMLWGVTKISKMRIPYAAGFSLRVPLKESYIRMLRLLGEPLGQNYSFKKWGNASNNFGEVKLRIPLNSHRCLFHLEIFVKPLLLNMTRPKIPVIFTQVPSLAEIVETSSTTPWQKKVSLEVGRLCFWYIYDI